VVETPKHERLVTDTQKPLGQRDDGHGTLPGQPAEIMAAAGEKRWP
jgi:hypothetical protein